MHDLWRVYLEHGRRRRNGRTADTPAGQLRAVRSFNAPALKPVHDATVLRHDIRLLAAAFEEAGDRERARIAELAAPHLATVDAAAYQAVPVPDRLRGYLLGQRKLPELLEVLRFERSGEARAAPVARGDGSEARCFVPLSVPRRSRPPDPR